MHCALLLLKRVDFWVLLEINSSGRIILKGRRIITFACIRQRVIYNMSAFYCLNVLKSHLTSSNNTKLSWMQTEWCHETGVQVMLPANVILFSFLFLPSRAGSCEVDSYWSYRGSGYSLRPKKKKKTCFLLDNIIC